MMSDDTRDGDWFPLTTAARSRGGGSGCCGWLQFMSRGTEPVSPPINEHSRTIVPDRKGGVVYVRTVYTQRGSVGVLQVTGSLLLLVIDSLLLYCAVLPFVFSATVLPFVCEFLHVQRLCLELLIQFVCGVKDNRRTVPKDSIVGAMAYGDSRGQFPGSCTSSVECS